MARFCLLMFILGLFPAAADSGTAADLLPLQNEVRKKVGVPPLEWSDKLAVVAQNWANTLMQRKEFQHQKKNRYGENLFEIFGAPATPAQVTAKWADEAAHFNYKSNKCTGGACGHYTQMVWRDTKRMGCAVARAPGREIWVCEYDPPGNYIGQRPY